MSAQLPEGWAECACDRGELAAARLERDGVLCSRSSIDDTGRLGTRDFGPGCSAPGSTLVAVAAWLLAKVESGGPPAARDAQWRPWARELLAKCARAENRIRADFDPEGTMGTQPEDPLAVDDDDLRELVESWALGNLSARQAALKAGLDLEQERTRPVAEFAHEARVRALSGGLLLSAGRVRLSLTRVAAVRALRAMREILEVS